MIYRSCPEYDPSNALVQPLMIYVDCRVETLIASAHQGTFGQLGQFGFLLTGCLTLVVGFYGFRLLMGAAQLSLSAIVPKLLIMGGLVAVVSSWPLFNTLFFGPFYASGEGLALAFLDGFGLQMSAGIYEQFDVWIGSAARLSNDAQTLSQSAGLQATSVGGLQAQAQTLAQASQAQNAQALQKPPVAAGTKLFLADAVPRGLLWAATIIAAFFSAGLMVTSKIVTACLLAIGPLVLVGVLFQATRGIFIGWLRFMLRIGVLQLFTVLFTAGLMQVQLPLLQKLELLTLSGPQSKQVLIAMLLVSLIFAALVGLAAVASKSLADGVRWPEAFANPGQSTTDQAAMRSETPPSTSQQRIGSIIAALEVGQTGSGASSAASQRSTRPAFDLGTPVTAPQSLRSRSQSIATAFEQGAG
ncbi:MAG: type IV secretion system protein [Pseudomonadota bacterium]